MQVNIPDIGKHMLTKPISYTQQRYQQQHHALEVKHWTLDDQDSLGDSNHDLLIPKRWRSGTTFRGVTFSPSQKGRFESPGILVGGFNPFEKY